MSSPTLKAYLLMRNDLPSLTPGKAMAHAFHAGNQMARFPGKPDSLALQMVSQYFSEGVSAQAYGFSTCICLSATRDEMFAQTSIARDRGWPYGVVHDPSYPFWVDTEIVPFLVDEVKVTPTFTVEGDRSHSTLVTRREYTCGWIICPDSHYIESLELHP